MSDVGELNSLEPKLGTSIAVTRSWLQIDNDWTLIVVEMEASIFPVHTIKRYGNG